MKKVLFLIALTLPVSAEEKPEADVCTSISSFAGTLMSARQNETPIVQSMEIIDKHFKGTSNKEYKKIAIEAYSERVWRTDEHKNSAISEFKNKYYLMCYKARNQ